MRKNSPVAKERQRPISWNEMTLLLCFVFHMLVMQVFAARGGSEYLYKDKEDAVSVLEYIRPKDWNVSGSFPGPFLSSSGVDDLPNFLSSPDYGNRVIAFYSPWCGHCINFAPKYMEMATETKKKNPDIDFYAVSCIPHRDICKKFSVRRYPSILMIRENSVTTHEVPLLDLEQEKFSISKLFQKSVADLEHDHIALSVLASFDWVSLLSNTLPEKWPASKMTKELLQNFDTLSKDKLEMIKVVSKYGEEKPSCYICGIWQILHVVTVGIAEQSKILPDAEKQSLAKDTVSTIRGFMENFFDSVQHVSIFNEINDSCWNNWCTSFDAITFRAEGKNWQNVALWMWDVHNHVNAELRRMAEQNEDTKSQNGEKMNERKEVWPSRENCKKCWDENGDYDRDSIYDHLATTYGGKNRQENETVSLVKLNAEKNLMTKTTMLLYIILIMIALWRTSKGVISPIRSSYFFGSDVHHD